jgi:hypothetical protein
MLFRGETYYLDDEEHKLQAPKHRCWPLLLRRPYSVLTYIAMGGFSVFTRTVDLLASAPSRTGRSPRDRLRGRCAFVIFNFNTLLCIVVRESSYLDDWD